MRPLLTLCLLLLPPALLAAEPTAPRSSDTIKKGLAFLTKEGVAWKENQKCASCHHVPMTIWALNEAKSRGFSVDEKALGDLVSWAVDPADPGKILPKRPDQKDPPVSLLAVLTSLAIEAGEVKAPPVRDGVQKMLTTVAGDQADEGHWNAFNGGRLPVFASKEVLSNLTLLALTAPDATEKRVKVAAEKGVKWLEKATAEDDLQAVALRLILWQRLGKSKEEQAELVKRILARQREDGGWAQTKEMESDAYATGVALYALAGPGTGAGDAVRKGQAFLVKTQQADGSWAMTSRPMKPGGKGATNLAPITHLGTGWATLGLLRSGTSP